VQQVGVVGEHGDVRGQRGHICDSMDERVLEMPADVGAGIGDQRDAAGADRFGAHQPEPLLDARQDEDVAPAHELRNVVPMAEDMNAWVGQLCRESLRVGREHFAGNEKRAGLGRRGTQPRFEREMEPFPDCGHADEQHRQSRPLRTLVAREERLLVKAVEMANEVLAGKSLVNEGLDCEVRGTEQAVSELIFGFLLPEHVLVVRVFVVRRELDTDSDALLTNDLVGESSVCVRSLEDARDPEATSRSQRLECPQRPHVHDIDRPGELRQPPRDDPIVNCECSELSQESIRDAKSPARKRWDDSDVGRKRAVHGGRKRQHLGPGQGHPTHLFPGCVTDPSGADSVREAVENAGRLHLLHAPNVTAEGRRPRPTGETGVSRGLERRYTPRAAVGAATSEMDDLAIIIVSTNEAHWLAACLGSVFEHAGSIDLDVVIADNESRDGTRELVGSSFPAARVVTCKNRGFAHANNRGALTTDARYVLFLNPDTEILEGTFENLVKAMDARLEVGLAGVKQVDAERRLTPTIRYFPNALRTLGEAVGSEQIRVGSSWLGEREIRMELYDEERVCDWTSGSFMLTRREALESAGLMDERFFIYSEEPDLSLRMKQAGWETRHLPLMTILHHEGKAGISDKMLAQDAFARRQYARKHFSRPHRAAYAAALGLRYALRVALPGAGLAASRRRGANLRALRTLLGRQEPPFGEPPPQALEPGARAVVARAREEEPNPHS
jgi:N-acetylglucosaminyl-diphospho-decaprenol L-rhamnosyltransferase